MPLESDSQTFIGAAVGLVDFATNRNRSAIYSYALMTLETPLVRHGRDWPVSEPDSARLHLA
jgi:hypothetical protein